MAVVAPSMLGADFGRLRELAGVPEGEELDVGRRRTALLKIGTGDTAEPQLVDRQSLANTRVVVIDRTGAVRLDVPGLMPDWMPPWR